MNNYSNFSVPVKRKNHWKEEDTRKLVELYLEGKPLAEIMKTLRIGSEQRIENKLMRLGYSLENLKVQR